MAFRQRTCFTAVCDDCGEEYENGEYTPHWDAKGDGIDEVVGMADWWASEDQKTLLCDDCAAKPHTAVPDKFDPEACARCPHPADEHEEVKA